MTALRAPRRLHEDPQVCPLCGTKQASDLGTHIRTVHGERALNESVLRAKEAGLSDSKIGERFGMSFRKLEALVTEAYGANISAVKRPRAIKRWEPKQFREETTTVWSFRQRGSWATHAGSYRGNWSPYIPRNLLLKYSNPGDLVLDYFCGGGTTAVEAKLLGRRCIARDINPAAVNIANENISFAIPDKLLASIPFVHEPEIAVGDARELSDIPDNSIDLICAHPPYAGIVKYSSNVQGDLSNLDLPAFLDEIQQVAHESFRVLRPGGVCAILVGDARKEKHVVPIGFDTLQQFLCAGFKLQELVIKRQHNCKTTGFWYKRSIEYNFLLLAHEYLPIFCKPVSERVSEQPSLWDREREPSLDSSSEHIPTEDIDNLESTTVWIFPGSELEGEVKRNLLSRFGLPESKATFANLRTGPTASNSTVDQSLIYVTTPSNANSAKEALSYASAVYEFSVDALKNLSSPGYLVVETHDIRCSDGELVPMGLHMRKAMSCLPELAIKEIVVVVPDDLPKPIDPRPLLDSSHRYLLVFARLNSQR